MSMRKLEHSFLKRIGNVVKTSVLSEAYLHTNYLFIIFENNLPKTDPSPEILSGKRLIDNEKCSKVQIPH